MKTIYLAIGSNLSNPKKQCRIAIDRIRRSPQCTLMQVAPYYTSPAMGRKKLPDYVNTVVAIKTRLAPLALLNKIQQFEKQQGRVRRTRWGARTIDIDIILYDKLAMQHPKLTIPHPRYLERDFVLIPLSALKRLLKIPVISPPHPKELR